MNIIYIILMPILLTLSIICFLLSFFFLWKYKGRLCILYGILGMIVSILYIYILFEMEIDICATLLELEMPGGKIISIPITILIPLLMLSIGCMIGYHISRLTKMIHLPQLIAIFHSFIGLAAMSYIYAFYLHHIEMKFAYSSNFIHTIILFLNTVSGMGLGGITFSASLLAFYKLQYNRRIQISNILLFIMSIVMGLLGTYYIIFHLFIDHTSIIDIHLGPISLGLSGIFMGLLIVNPIAGADMPVVISILNAISGYTAAASGIFGHNMLLVAIGGIVGASGTFLSYIMCKAMNKSLWSLYYKQSSATQVAASSELSASEKVQQTPQHNIINIAQAIEYIKQSTTRVIIPGYGMASAKAQYNTTQLGNILDANYVIHTVAGRMPGHMHVLLAEAKAPYQQIKEMEEIDFNHVDLAIIIGANDIVNPLALQDVPSPIKGMQVLEVWKAKHVICIKRSIYSTGYSKIDNQLFTMQNVSILLGDANDILTELCIELKKSSGNKQ